MHEFSIGESLVRIALEELARAQPAGRLARARVVIGGMHQIVPDNLRMAYAVLSRGTPAAGSELELVAVPILARCRACAWSGEIELPIFQCGACGAGNLDIVGGRELYLDKLEVMTDGNQGLQGSDG